MEFGIVHFSEKYTDLSPPVLSCISFHFSSCVFVWVYAFRRSLMTGYLAKALGPGVMFSV